MPTVATIAPEASVAGLLTELTVHNIGAMVVVDRPARLVGIVSERDVVRKLHEQGADAAGAVGRRTIMTTVSRRARRRLPSTDLSALMTEKRVRHIPVWWTAGWRNRQHR